MITLSQRLEFLVMVRCCRTRHYRPEDLIAVYGNLQVLRLEGRVACEDCGRRDCATIRVVYPSAGERQALRVRRLVELRTVKVPVWRDE